MQIHLLQPASARGEYKLLKARNTNLGCFLLQRIYTGEYLEILQLRSFFKIISNASSVLISLAKTYKNPK